MNRVFVAALLVLASGGCGAARNPSYTIAQHVPQVGDPEHFLVRVDNNSLWEITLGVGTNQQGQTGPILVPSGGHVVFDIGFLPSAVTLHDVQSYPIAYVTFAPQTQTLGRDYAATDAVISFGVP